MAIHKKIILFATTLFLCGTSTLAGEEMLFIRMLETFPKGDERFKQISRLGLEEYTLGVLQTEMEPTWPLEVLKAQAVLARTNAVYAFLKNKGKPFDLTRVLPQVYTPVTQCITNAQSAIEETRGLVLVYDGKIIPAYFHSVCGGSTETAKNVWKNSTPYPAAVSCRFCKDAPKFRWSHRMPTVDFQDRLIAAGLDVRDLYDVIASKVSAAGDRVTEIIVDHGGGKTMLRTNMLRSILGHNVLRSTNFTVVRRGPDLIFKGQGWGHGVGLCQWGARGMAMAGKDFQEILAFYYPGIRIWRVKEAT